MNKAVEIFMEEAATLGYTAEAREKVVELTTIKIENRYRCAVRKLRDTMEDMTIDELKAIVAEMQEGGEL